MASSVDTCIENKLHLGLKPHQRNSPNTELSEIARKLAFLIRRKYGPNVSTNQISVVFHDRCGHRPEGAVMLKCVNIFVHMAPGREGMDHFIHVRGLQDDDLVRDLHKEVDTPCFYTMDA